MRAKLLWAMLAAALSCFGGIEHAKAGMLGSLLGLRSAIERIKLDRPTLAPMSYTRFCMKYVDDCYPQNTELGTGFVRLSDEALGELSEVNDTVNTAIVPEGNELGLANEVWSIAPQTGDCNDYAVTKRHELLARGWPSDTLLLAEVALGEGEHHLVLVVRTDRGDMVLDSMSDQIKTWTRTAYRWIRIQSPNGSMLWRRWQIGPDPGTHHSKVNPLTPKAALRLAW